VGWLLGWNRSGSAQRILYYSVSRKYFSMQTNPEKSRNVFKAKKISRTSPKIRERKPKIDEDMRNPNKVIGAHENILEPSNK
jgi:hypothetical protein